MAFRGRNNRPIRTRPPGRRPRRPAVWRDGNSTGTLFATAGNPWALLAGPVATVAQVNFRETLAGDIDADTLDRAEVRVDRIVGDIAFYTEREATNASALAGPLPPVVRFALVLEEDPLEVGTINTASYDLFDADALRDVEWMYLEQLEWRETITPIGAEGTTARYRYHYHSHLDIRVRRNLGKADRLWLVMMYGNGLEATAGSNTWTDPVYEAHMLRSVLVA